MTENGAVSRDLYFNLLVQFFQLFMSYFRIVLIDNFLHIYNLFEWLQWFETEKY